MKNKAGFHHVTKTQFAVKRFGPAYIRYRYPDVLEARTVVEFID